ncbi:MAG: DUF4251 domain-containing protein [Alistipes sp.]|nr:DUF4251 domain-containing protein [Alistipes sp.]MBR2628755.1 DUF4251 domain-containing protein [Alistipes sp.]
MKRLPFIFVCILCCTYCGPNVQQATAQTNQHYTHLTHEQRVERRAERMAEYEKFIDSLVQSRNFEFNPQTVQQLPAGGTTLLSNPTYTVTLWRGSVDVCLPYYVGYVPPYRYVLINTVTPNVTDYQIHQTSEGWSVVFKCPLYATGDYTFTFDINSRLGGATLTISYPWYSPVQYTGTLSKIY